MSVTQQQRNVNTLDNDIANLEKKKAVADKESAELQAKINSAQKNIARTKSDSLRNSKIRQINTWERDKSNKLKDSADISKKIADKRNKRNDAYLKLQKEQEKEQKMLKRNHDKTIESLKKSYESRIDHFMNNTIPNNIHKKEKSMENHDEEMFDVFISHAHEDKASFVDDFVKELKGLNIKAWYDNDTISWGDSMRERIDEGLKKSTFGIVILSPEYIAEGKYWTKTELNGLFQLESINGKTLLPIWHGLTKKDVMNYSPLIANKKAMSTAWMMPNEIADELHKLLSIE